MDNNTQNKKKIHKKIVLSVKTVRSPTVISTVSTLSTF